MQKMVMNQHSRRIFRHPKIKKPEVHFIIKIFSIENECKTTYGLNECKTQNGLKGAEAT